MLCKMRADAALGSNIHSKSKVVMSDFLNYEGRNQLWNTLTKKKDHG